MAFLQREIPSPRLQTAPKCEVPKMGSSKIHFFACSVMALNAITGKCGLLQPLPLTHTNDFRSAFATETQQ